jgi:nucleosome binding factor SPN SPT16 subunit
MKAGRLRAVEMVRRIRDRHARQLAGKTDAEIIAFYRAAGQAAMDDVRRKPRARTRKAG